MKPVRVEDLKKIAEGREAEIFAWEEATVLRLLRTNAERDRERLENEAAAMRAAAAAGVPVPRVGDLLSVDGRVGLVMQRLYGVDLRASISKHPWRLYRYARLAGEMHARLNSTPAPEGLQPLREYVARRVKAAPLPHELSRFVLATLDRLPDGDAICHGDFHPANIMETAEGPVIIDWANVARGDPGADLARSLLILRLGHPPPGSSILIRLATTFVRSQFARRYERAYLSRKPTDLSGVKAWEVVRAAERLAEGIDAERPRLMAIVTGAYKSALSKTHLT